MCRDPAGRAGLSQRGSNSKIRARGRGGVNYRWWWGDRMNIKGMQNKWEEKDEIEKFVWTLFIILNPKTMLSQRYTSSFFVQWGEEERILCLWLQKPPQQFLKYYTTMCHCTVAQLLLWSSSTGKEIYIYTNKTIALFDDNILMN